MLPSLWFQCKVTNGFSVVLNNHRLQGLPEKEGSAKKVLIVQDAADYYEFSDIRYAAPPLDHLRFEPPTPPMSGIPFMQEDRPSRVCPQSVPLDTSSVPQPISQSEANATDRTTYNQLTILEAPSKKEYQTEDCLFLDIFVPRTAFDKRRQVLEGDFQGVPVLVWIHGQGPSSTPQYQFLIFP